MDSIGLGSFLANIVYVIIFLISISGIAIFWRKKNILGCVFWASLMLNLFSFLFFMGEYGSHPKALYLVVNRYWPLINLLLAVILIAKYIKNKK